MRIPVTIPVFSAIYNGCLGETSTFILRQALFVANTMTGGCHERVGISIISTMFDLSLDIEAKAMARGKDGLRSHDTLTSIQVERTVPAT